MGGGEALRRLYQFRALKADEGAESGMFGLVEQGQTTRMEFVFEKEFIDEAVEELFEMTALPATNDYFSHSQNEALPPVRSLRNWNLLDVYRLEPQKTVLDTW